MNTKKNKNLQLGEGTNSEILSIVSHGTIPFTTKSTKGGPERNQILNSSNPIPIYTVKFKMPLVDIIEDNIQKKCNYTNEKEINFKKLHSHYRRKVVTEQKANVYMKNYVENLIRDPAPHVQGLDWNFTRNALGIVEKNDKEFLITANDKKSFKVLEIQRDMNLECDQAIRNEDRFLRELMVTDNFVGMRLKKKVKIVNLKEIEEMNHNDIIETHNSYEYKKVSELIASAIFDKQLIVVDSDQNLVRYDLSTKNPNFTFCIPKNTSRLCVMPYSVSGAKKSKAHADIFFTNCLEFGTIDSRVKLEDNERIKSMSFENHFATKCEKIFNHCQSLNRNDLTYIVSSHMLYCIDHRQMKEPLIRWTHFMRKPPMMITTSLYGGAEVICLSSNSPGDIKLFNYDGHAINHIPFVPPTVQHTFNDFCEEGHFLLSNIRERLPLSANGIALKCEVERASVRLFSQNLAGDIFETSLKCHKSKIKNDKTFEAFKKWDELLYELKDPEEFLTAQEKLERQDLIVDDIVRMDLTKVFLDEEEEKPANEDEDNNLFTEKIPAWKISIEKARNYKDLLAKEIMNIWDLEIEEVKPTLFAEALEATEQSREDSSDRISRWLRATNNDEIMIEEVNLTDNMDLDESQTVEIVTDELRIPVPTPKSTVKKKPRIAGF